MRSFGCGEEGLTLIELLIVVGILSILAAVVTPNLLGFLPVAKLAAANTEVANVKTAALAYYADNAGGWPGTSGDLYGGDVNYLNAAPDGTYFFNLTTYFIDSATPGPSYTKGLSFNATGQQWERQ